MINCHIRLYGSLRDESPVVIGGRFDLQVPEHATIADAISTLKLTGNMHVAVNGELVLERDYILSDDDKIEIFRPAAGG